MTGSASHPPAVVIGLKENGLGVVRALAAAGIASVAVDGPEWHPAHATRHCREIVPLRAWSAEALLDALEGLSGRLSAPAPILITQDEPVLWLSRHRGDLGDAYVLDLPGDETVQLLMSKRGFQERAEREGWPVPKTWFADGADDMAAVVDVVPLPCILKPQVKNEAFRSHSPKKAFKITDRADLMPTYEQVARWEKEVVVQEWIEGDDERVSFCLGFAPGGDRPPALFAGRKLRQWPIDCGNTVLSEPAPEVWAPELEEITRSIWHTLAYRGLGSVEFKQRPETDEPIIMEPTVGRTNYQNEVAVLNGCNLPAIAWASACGRSGPPRARHGTVKLVDGRRELRAALAYRRAGRLDLGRWWRQRAGAKRYVLWRADDPRPGLAGARQALRDAAAELAHRALPAPLVARLRRWSRRAR